MPYEIKKIIQNKWQSNTQERYKNKLAKEKTCR